MSDNMVHDSCKTYVSIYDINAACKRQKTWKSYCSLDDMAMEALLYGTNRLYFHLAIYLICLLILVIFEGLWFFAVSQS